MAFIPRILSELRGILSSGGQRRIARKILGGTIGGILSDFVDSVFGVVSDDAKSALTDHSQQMVDAGGAQTFSPGGAPIDQDIIPANPLTFGDDPSGRRFRYDVEVFEPASGKSVRVQIESGTQLSNAEIAGEATVAGSKILSYEKFGIGPVEPEDTLVIGVDMIEKVF